MSGTIDFQSRIESIKRILEIGQYTSAATECVKLSEQALRYVSSHFIDQVDEAVKEKTLEAARKRGGLDRLTMGQMVRVLQESKFIEAWAQVSGKSVTSLQVIDLENLTHLRNRVMHDAAEASYTEAEFLLNILKMILETFGMLTFEAAKTPITQEETSMNTSEEKPQSGMHVGNVGNMSGNAKITQAGRDHVEGDIGGSGDKITGGTKFGNVKIGNGGGNSTLVQTGGDFHGDIVGGNKITQSETTTATVTYGFKQDADKEEFLKQIEELRATLREIKSAIPSLDELDEDKKDDLEDKVRRQVKDLKTVKEIAEATPVGKKPRKENAEIVGNYLDKTTTLMKKLKKMGDATAAASEKIMPGVVKALPLLASVRRLFGLP